MEVLIIAAVVIAAFGAITLGWVLAQGESKTAAPTAESADQPTETPEATADQSWTASAQPADEATPPERPVFEPAAPRANGQIHAEPPLADRVVEADRFEPVTPSSLFVVVAMKTGSVRRSIDLLREHKLAAMPQLQAELHQFVEQIVTAEAINGMRVFLKEP